MKALSILIVLTVFGCSTKSNKSMDNTDRASDSTVSLSVDTTMNRPLAQLLDTVATRLTVEAFYAKYVDALTVSLVVEAFYAKYVDAFLNDKDHWRVISDYCTPRLVDSLKSESWYADPFLIAQDFSNEAKESLNFKQVSPGKFIISWFDAYNEYHIKSKLTIELKDGNYKVNTILNY